MDKSTLEAKLEELKQKSSETIEQVNQYNEASKNLTDEALMIKGEYRAIERLIAEWEDKPKGEKKVMPRVNPQDLKPTDIYGDSDVDNTLMFRERLMKLFKPHETVQVMNIDDEPIKWQFMPEYAETNTFTDEGIKITHREEPEIWEIGPGEVDYLLGDCAYHMIEALYKKMVIKKVGVVENPTSAKQIRNFNFKDPIRQEQMIALIYQGKVTPSFNQAQSNKVEPKKADATIAKKPV